MYKLCAHCHKRKQISEFFKNSKRKDSLQTYCKTCKKFYDQEYYKKHKERQRERVKRHLLENRQKLWKFLEEHSCVDCGESNPVVLEFDHINRESKKGSIAFLLSSSKSSWITIAKEIRKCEVRCANCHRIKTARQLQWYQFDKSR